MAIASEKKNNEKEQNQEDKGKLNEEEINEAERSKNQFISIREKRMEGV